MKIRNGLLVCATSLALVVGLGAAPANAQPVASTPTVSIGTSISGYYQCRWETIWWDPFNWAHTARRYCYWRA
jgi:hypothetical protein